MKIQLNTDKNIDGHDQLAAHVEGIVSEGLERFQDRITRIEIHLSDENGSKPGDDDKRCLMEARLEGRAPAAVTHQAASIDQAVAGATGKLRRALETVLGKERG